MGNVKVLELCARLHAKLLAWDLIKSKSDTNLYIAHVGTGRVVLIVYVDDKCVTRNNLSLITQLKNHVRQTFETNDLGPIERYMGFQFDIDPSGLRHQIGYALNILHQFAMDSCAPHSPLLESLTLSKGTSTPCVDATSYWMLGGQLFLTKTYQIYICCYCR